MAESFRGYAVHNMDDKGRIVVPQKLREGLGSQFVLTRGSDGNILLCPEPFFKRLEKRAKKMPVNSKVRFFLLSGCEDAVVDKQGRIVIPNHLRVHGGLEKECVYSGSIDFVQLWSKERYDQYLGAINMEDINEELNDFVLDDEDEDEADGI